MQAVRNYQCVFGRNLYDTNETHSILEIRWTLYFPIFEEMKSSLLTVADFLFSCSDASHFDVGLILYFLQCICKEKNYDAHCKIVHWRKHGITHMRLWSSVMMQYTGAKQAEEKWSLH